MIFLIIKKSFEKYFLKSLTSRLTDYSSSKFEIIGEDKKSANYTIVNSKVIPKMEVQKLKLIGEFILKIQKNLYKRFNCRRFKFSKNSERGICFNFKFK